MELNYFVYYHIRLDINTVFYVGVGTKAKTGNAYKRAYMKCDRTDFWKKIINKTSYKVDILRDFETKLEALKYESRLIELFGLYKEGGTLCNFIKDTYIGDNKSSSINVCTKNCKKIYQYDLDGNFIKEYKSLKSAAESVKANPSDISQAALMKKIFTCKNFQWRFEKFDKIEATTVKRIRDEFLKKVYQFDLFGNLVAEYKNPKEAEYKNNIKNSFIRACLTGKHNRTCKGFYWSYDKDFVVKDNVKAKIIYIYDKELNLLNSIIGTKEAAKYVGVSRDYIIKCCKNLKAHDKYIISWKKLNNL